MGCAEEDDLEKKGLEKKLRKRYRWWSKTWVTGWLMGKAIFIL